MEGHDLLERVIEQLYDAAIEPEGWPEALENLGALLRSPKIVIALEIPSKPLLWLMNRSATADDEQSCGCKNLDTIQSEGKPFPAGLSFDATIQKIITGRGTGQHQLWWGDAGSSDDLPAHLQHALGLELVNTESLRAHMLCLRPAEVGPFTEAERILLGQLRQQLRRIVKIYAHTLTLIEQDKLLLAVLDRLPFGVFLLDQQARVLFRNKRATEHNCQSLSDCTGTGSPLCRMGVNTGLTEAISKAVTGSCQQAQHLRIECRQTARPLAMTLVPLEKRGQHPLLADAVVALFMGCMNRNNALQPSDLQQLFDLTANESRLTIALLGGSSLPDAARQMGITAGTARQYLKQIFRKTRCHRQVELLNLLLCLGNHT